MKYIPQSETDLNDLCQSIGIKSVDELFSGIPESLRVKDNLDYPTALSEIELRDYFKELAEYSPQPKMSFAGAGVYQHDIPSIVPYIQARSEYATAYTPYQPEISQGLLQCIFEYQTLACQLTEMELSNASLYDGATSLGEAALMALRIKKKAKGKILVPTNIHPAYRQVLDTYLEHFSDRIEELPYKGDRIDLDALKSMATDADFIITQSPNIFGVIEDYAAISKIVKDNELFWMTSTMEALSFAFLRGPGAFGADIVTGEGQSFGNATYLGGSSYGIFTCKQDYIRNLPGRLVGETVDQDGKRSYVLTFATREQFIRRGRATSNICTNNNLNMIAGLFHMVTLGKTGLKQLAHQNFSKSEYAKKSLRNAGLKVSESPSFNEFVVETSKEAAEYVAKAADENWICGVDLGIWRNEWKHKLLVHTSELHKKDQIDQLANFLQKA